MVEWGTPTQKRKEYQVLIKKYRLGRERKEPVKKIIKIAFRYEIAKKKERRGKKLKLCDARRSSTMFTLGYSEVQFGVSSFRLT